MSDISVPSVPDPSTSATPAEPSVPTETPAVVESASATPEASPQEAATPSEETPYTFNGSIEEASAEIRRLRDENAQRRLASKEVDESLSAFSAEEERKAWLELGKLWKTDPNAAAEAFRMLAEGVSPAEQQQMQQAAEEGASGYDGAEPLTEARLQEILSQRDHQAATKAELAKIDLETAKLGLQTGSVDYEAVLQLAMSRTNGDIAKAHSLYEQNLDARVQARIEEIRSSAGTTPPVVGEGGPNISVIEPPKTFKEARARAKEFLAGVQNS